MLKQLLLLGALAAPVAAQSGSLSTGFGGPMSGGQVMYFDLVSQTDLSISSLDVRIQDGNPGTFVRIFRRDGTSLNNEGTASGWSAVAQGTIPNPNSVSLLSSVTLDQSIPLPAGRHGIMIEYVGDVPRYSDGLFPLGRLAADNADLEIYEGSAGNTPFSGRCCAPRVFSGTVYYDLGVSGPIGGSYCTASPNSTGVPTQISAFGSDVAASNDVLIRCESMPLNAVTLLVASQTQGFVVNPGGSQGNLCLSGSVGRFLGSVANSGAAGSIEVSVDLSAIPQPNGTVSAMAGESWNFQCWHRDVNPSVTSNFSNGVSILFP